MKQHGGAIAFAMLFAAAIPATADTRIEGRYAISIAGLTIGTVAVVLDVRTDGYVVAGSAKLTGVVRAIASAHGTAAVRGNIVGARLVPQSYVMTAESQKKTDEVRIAMANGTVRDFSAVPPLQPEPDRVPLSEAHLKGVLDPLSAALFIVPGTGDVLSPEVCNRTIAVFDGRYRYEVEFSFVRIESVSGAKGYSGQTVLCNVAYRPIAGHRTTKTATRYEHGNDKIRIWFAPIPGTRALVPYRATVGTVLGNLVLQTTAFNTEEKERAAATPAPRSR